MEGLVIVEEGYDTQAHCAQQEYPVSSHFHPRERERERKHHDESQIMIYFP